MVNVPIGNLVFLGETFYKVTYHSNGSFSTAGLNGPEKDQLVQRQRQMLADYMELAKSVITEDKAEADAYGYSMMGSEVRPPNLYSEVEKKDGISHERFEERKRSGAIMMSDYLRYKMTVITSPGYKTIGNPKIYTTSVGSSVFIDNGKLIPAKNNRGTEVLLIAGTDYARAKTGALLRYERRLTDGSWSYPSFPDAQSFIDSIMDQKPDPKPLVTKTAAYANKRSLDVLTAAAEMPKTIASALRGLRLVASIIKDFKKGKFHLTKATAHRNKVITKRYDARIAFIDNQRLNPRNSNKRKAELNERRKKLVLKKRTTLAESAQEFADALADLWLNFRYNIMPNVYLLQDIEKALARVDHKFITARSKSVDEIVFEGPGWRFTDEFTTRCVIKRRFGDKSRFTAGGPQLSADLFTTAWELIPLSFVIDWFVRIGDWLAAWSFKNDWDQQGATLSELVQINQTVNLFPDPLWTIEPQVRVHGFYYKRRNINPTNYIGLCWQPNLDLARKTDALALIWRPVRSQLQQKR